VSSRKNTIKPPLSGKYVNIIKSTSISVKNSTNQPIDRGLNNNAEFSLVLLTLDLP
jgi:hypothetical protein